MSSIVAVHADSATFNSARPQLDRGQQTRGRALNTFPYGTGANSWFQGGLPTPPAATDMIGTSLGNSYGSYPSSTQYMNGQRVNHGAIDPHSTPYPSDPYTHSRQGSNTKSAGQRPYESVEANKSNQIASHLQIPESVNKSKGSLAEFAAEITCLFWFESADTLEYAENLSVDTYPDRGLNPDATPTVGFRKWVTTILSTTQVGKNVILLALMFIYRLKKFNPTVSGKRGSEFRLLTIALMLGNKFLDDNTYTNKTWAEVSGISVNEIHIMEVEFLSNMRYELYASESEWIEWKARLGRFGAFYEKASRVPLYEESKTNAPSTPTSQTIPHKLPSPPSRSHSVISTGYSTLPNPMTTLPKLQRSPARQYGSSAFQYERKRSLDTTIDLPPAKRVHYPMTSVAQPSPSVLPPTSAYTAESVGSTPIIPGSGESLHSNRIPQLPMPRIPNTANSSSMHLAPLSLPSNRAMAIVYPNTITAYPQPVTPISAIPQNVAQLYPNAMPNLGDGSRVPSNNSSAHTSPVNMYGAATPTRPGLSPSYFLTNRSSPYRPVRNVNTLLFPPPSAAMQNSMRNIGYDQIHYQPLSKNSTERHTGPVPYLQPDAWQSHTSTPLSQQYRPY